MTHTNPNTLNKSESRKLTMLIWQKRLWLLRGILALFVLWLCLMGMTLWQMNAYSTTQQTQPTDVIIVLGAGVNPNGSAGYALTRRARQAAQLWHNGIAPYILCTGGHAPRRPNSEAEACHEVLLNNGVPASAIFLEPHSRSTEENALNSSPILQTNNWQIATLVTDSFHIFRAGIIFDYYNINHTLSAVPAHLMRGYPTYEQAIFRELLALNWFHFKNTLGIPLTYIP